MVNPEYTISNMDIKDMNLIKELFASVFTIEPWNDDWSDTNQLEMYIEDIIGQKNSLTYGIYKDNELVGVSMGHISHWYTGTEYHIDEFCIKTVNQGKGIGSLFLDEIENSVKKLGIKQIVLQTDKNVTAFHFYKANNFCELKNNVILIKEI